MGVILVICMLGTSACLHVEVKEHFESNIKITRSHLMEVWQLLMTQKLFIM